MSRRSGGQKTGRLVIELAACWALAGVWAVAGCGSSRPMRTLVARPSGVGGHVLLRVGGREPLQRVGGREPLQRVGGRELAARVDHVVDGDTLDVRLDGRFVRVRTVQIDAPESSSLRFGRPDRCGRPSKGFAEKLTAPGATVWLEFSGRDRYDGYGRLLALVHLGRPGGPTWQERMVRAGWAEVMVFRGNRTRLLGALQADQADARAEDLGVYARCGGRFHGGDG
jgi:micrococcal nuclease